MDPPHEMDLTIKCTAFISIFSILASRLPPRRHQSKACMIRHVHDRDRSFPFRLLSLWLSCSVSTRLSLSVSLSVWLSCVLVPVLAPFAFCVAWPFFASWSPLSPPSQFLILAPLFHHVRRFLSLGTSFTTFAVLFRRDFLGWGTLLAGGLLLLIPFC